MRSIYLSAMRMILLAVLALAVVAPVSAQDLPKPSLVSQVYALAQVSHVIVSQPASNKTHRRTLVGVTLLITGYALLAVGTRDRHWNTAVAGAGLGVSMTGAIVLATR